MQHVGKPKNSNTTAGEGADKKRRFARDRFRKLLLNGTLTVGSNLTQSELAELLGVSLTPLRELLVLLEDYGLIEVKHRAGITITYPDISFIRENVQFRSIIEISGLEKLVLSATDDWIKNQINKHEKARASVQDSTFDLAQYSSNEFDRPFHLAMVQSLENPTILRTYERIIDNIALAELVHRRQYTCEQLTDTLNEHLAILSRLSARDVEGAVAALKGHFSLSTHRIIGG